MIVHSHNSHIRFRHSARLCTRFASYYTNLCTRFASYYIPVAMTTCDVGLESRINHVKMPPRGRTRSNQLYSMRNPHDIGIRRLTVTSAGPTALHRGQFEGSANPTHGRAVGFCMTRELPRRDQFIHTIFVHTAIFCINDVVGKSKSQLQRLCD